MAVPHNITATNNMHISFIIPHTHQKYMLTTLIIDFSNVKSFKSTKGYVRSQTFFLHLDYILEKVILTFKLKIIK